jgi:hypothetical protein
MGRTPRRLAGAIAAALLAVPVALAQREPPPLPPPLKPAAPPPAGTGELPPPAPAPEVQARGPVHEAFAEPATPPSAAPVVPKPPPPPVKELPPPQKPAGKGVQWIPGYWQWDEERNNYLWVSGCWRLPPPGKVWLPGRWQEVSRGWQWVSGSWVEGQRSEVGLLPPPPPPKEQPAPRLAPGQVYEPGCWVYRDNRYVWRPGFALAVPKGWVWVSARYSWTPAGCIFVEGHWDYPLGERGLLFAPVAFPGSVAATTQYVPSYVVREECLLGSLFVRAAARHYYFGDYFEQRYQRQGFVPWTSYHLPGAEFDSLFGYYRQHAGDGKWEPSIRALFAARYAGKVPRPPRTLVAQETVIRKVSTQEVRRLTVLAPLARPERHGFKVETIARAELSAYQQSAAALAQLGVQFQQSEWQVYSDKKKGKRPAEGVVAVKWKKGHPHEGPVGKMKNIAVPPFPDDPFGSEDGPKGGKHKKGKGKGK